MAMMKRQKSALLAAREVVGQDSCGVMEVQDGFFAALVPRSATRFAVWRPEGMKCARAKTALAQSGISGAWTRV